MTGTYSNWPPIDFVLYLGIYRKAPSCLVVWVTFYIFECLSIFACNYSFIAVSYSFALTSSAMVYFCLSMSSCCIDTCV